MALNLAKRPFVDTRPVNALTALLVVLVLGLSGVSWRTFHDYLEGSRDTQAAITELKGEITRLDQERRATETRVSLYDVSDLAASAEDVNAIKSRQAFSWTRFLTRLEEVLPKDVRVAAIALARTDAEAASGSASEKGPGARKGMPLQLTLVTRDALGLPKVIRAFYASPYFDEPVPFRDESPERGTPEGRRLFLSVAYLDEGRVVPPAPAAAPPPGKGSTRVARGGAR